jgi:uncharacterized protein YegL
MAKFPKKKPSLLDSNPEPCAPLVFLLDTSGSMAGPKLKQVEEGLALVRSTLQANVVASERVEILVLTFGPDVKVVQDFVRSAEWADPPALTAGGQTPLCGAVLRAGELLEERLQAYKAAGLDVPFRPRVFLVTDGAPTDSDRIVEAKALLEAGRKKGRYHFIAVGVEGADLAFLARLCPAGTEPYRLQGLDFSQFFRWASQDAVVASQKQVGGDEEDPVPPDGTGLRPAGKPGQEVASPRHRT